MPNNEPCIRDVLSDLMALHHEYLDPNVRGIQLIQEETDVWLEVTYGDGREPKRENLDYINDHDGPWFRIDRTPPENTKRLMELDRMGLLHACPAMFSDAAVIRIQEEYEAWQVRRAQPRIW